MSIKSKKASKMEKKKDLKYEIGDYVAIKYTNRDYTFIGKVKSFSPISIMFDYVIETNTKEYVIFENEIIAKIPEYLAKLWELYE